MIEHEAIVVGGGITGLSAVHQLRARGVEDVLLLERDAALGGKLITTREDGFIVEGGPDCFLTMKTGAVELCRRIGLSDRLTPSIGGRVYIKRGGRLHEIPEGVIGLAPSRVAPLMTTRILSIPGRLRAALELLIPTRTESADDETVREFASRRFGEEAYTWLMEPLMGGIHAADGDALSLAATYPQLAALEQEHGSVMRGMFKRMAHRRKGSTRSPFMAPLGGMAEMVETLQGSLPNAAIGRGEVVRVARVEHGQYELSVKTGDVMRCRTLLVATPAGAAAEMLGSLDQELADALRTIPFVSVATVTLAAAHGAAKLPVKSSGYLTPRAEGGLVSACTITSNKFPERAPDGMALIRVFLGRAGAPDPTEMDDGKLVDLASAEIRNSFAFSGTADRTWISRWPAGMPQYNQGHLDRVERVDRAVAGHPGLFLAGASYRGIGVPDCVESGERAANGAADWVGHRAALGATV